MSDYRRYVFNGYSHNNNKNNDRSHYDRDSMILLTQRNVRKNIMVYHKK